MSDKLKKRYEEMRQLCLRYANFHPDDKSVCHQSLGRAPGHIPAVAVQLASLLDDMALTLTTRPTPSTLLDREKVIKWIAANSKLANQGPEIVRVVQIAPLLEAINSGNLGADE